MARILLRPPYLTDIKTDEGPVGEEEEESRRRTRRRRRRSGMLTSCPRCDAPLRSPSEPLSFGLPADAGGGGGGGEEVGRSGRSPPLPEADLDAIRGTLRRLRASGWYHEALTWRDSAALLGPTSPGTFLLRDSSDPRFLFSLSVQTRKGPTSVRLHYVDGQFRVDAVPALVSRMPLFDCVVALVEFYVRETREPRLLKSEGKEQVWVDREGSLYSDIHLSRPLYTRDKFPSLQHLARLALNSAPELLPPSALSSLPLTLASYLRDYPYTQ